MAYKLNPLLLYGIVPPVAKKQHRAPRGRSSTGSSYHHSQWGAWRICASCSATLGSAELEIIDPKGRPSVIGDGRLGINLSLLILWKDSETCSTASQGSRNWAPLFSLPFHFLPFFICPSWGHFPNKLLVPKLLVQDLLLGELKLG